MHGWLTDLLAELHEKRHHQEDCDAHGDKLEEEDFHPPHPVFSNSVQCVQPFSQKNPHSRSLAPVMNNVQTGSSSPCSSRRSCTRCGAPASREMTSPGIRMNFSSGVISRYEPSNRMLVLGHG